MSSGGPGLPILHSYSVDRFQLMITGTSSMWCVDTLEKELSGFNPVDLTLYPNGMIKANVPYGDKVSYVIVQMTLKKEHPNFINQLNTLFQSKSDFQASIYAEDFKPIYAKRALDGADDNCKRNKVVQ